MRATRAFLCGGVVLAGCTFAGVANYDISECEPGLPLASDACNVLNGGNTSCKRWQCEASSRRCVLSTLDADKDGDPPIACGGTDCDDGEPRRSGHFADACDGIDNDCDGISDNGLLTIATAPTSSVPLVDRRTTGADPRLVAADRQDGYATYLGASAPCVHGLVLGEGASDAGSGCIAAGDLPDAAALPPDGGMIEPPNARQPVLERVGVERESAIAAAFVEEHPPSDCADGDQLVFVSRSAERIVRADCGAALPTLAGFPLQASAIAAFYGARARDRSDPIAGCAVEPASLRVRWIDGATSTSPNATTSAAIDLGLSSSTRPPALAPVPGSTFVLLASPIDTSVGLWMLTPDGRVVPLAPAIGALADARAVAMSVAVEGTHARIAIAAETGCPPAQSMRIAVTTLDTTTGLLGEVGKEPFAVLALGEHAPTMTAPAIAWSAARHEWWVTWIDDRQHAILRRVASDARAADVPVDLGEASLSTIRSPIDDPLARDGGTGPSPTAILLRRDQSALDELGLVCRPP